MQDGDPAAEPDTVWVWIRGESLLLWKRNPRPANCRLCGRRLETLEGFRRRMDTHLQGTGYLCLACVASEIRSEKFFAYSPLTGCLSPFTTLFHSFQIPAETLAQAWERGGAAELKATAEREREAARKAWREEKGLSEEQASGRAF